MARKKRRNDIVSRGMKMISHQPQRLRRISKTVQEENPVSIPLLHVDRFGAGDRTGFGHGFRSHALG